MQKPLAALWRVTTFPFRLIFNLLAFPFRAFKRFRLFLNTEPEEHPLGDVVAGVVTDPDFRQHVWAEVDALRRHLLRALIGLALAVAISFYFTQRIVDFLAIPVGGLQAMKAIEVTESVGVFMRVALLSGIALALPYIAFELWAFAAPGLRPRERKFGLFGIPLATLLFISGMAFTYFMLLPTALPFLLNFMGIEAQLRPQSYFSFLTGLMFWIGITFEFPLVIYVLTAMGFIKPQTLARQWRLAIVIIAILAAAIPCDDPHVAVIFPQHWFELYRIRRAGTPTGRDRPTGGRMKLQPRSPRYVLIALMIVFALFGQACSLSLIKLPQLFPPVVSTGGPATALPPETPQTMTQTTFVVSLPEPLAGGESLYLTTMDEVTGLSLNAKYYPMQPRDGLTYSATVPLPLNAVVKYRYTRRGAAQVNEDTSLGAPVRYRLYQVLAQSEIQDIVSDWVDKVYSRQTGRIAGRVLNADTGAPIPNILVTAGGVQYLSDSAGRFTLEGMPVGTQNLVAYALDGLYQPFQQGASFGAGHSTNVDLLLHPAPHVTVTFNVSVPASTVTGAPVRVAGNLLQLGNTFADLQGGLSTNTDRMPLLSFTAEGRYTATISLPVGAYVEYKYTLGDGFWNAEHNSAGEFVLRSFVVPAQDIVLQDQVNTWQAGTASGPILFEVHVPSTTPAGDIIYIQFNPYGWTEPLPMWPLGNNRWAYKLYSPLNMLGSFGYRYCRNGQCGSADDKATMGASTQGRISGTSLASQDIQDTVNSWAWYENPEPTTLVGASITPRSSGFTAGVEFQPFYRPNWSYFAPPALANIQALGANEVVFNPTWTYKSINPPDFTTSPGSDPLWIDSAIMISQARALGLQVAIFPAPRFPTTAAAFWSGAPRDDAWWQSWFDRYRAFAVNYADLAAQSGSQTLILGGDWLAPALPNGKLADGSPSGVPADVEARWTAVITEVRSHFNGNILWALPYTEANLQTPLSFLQDTDGIYLLWSAALTTQGNATKNDLANEAGRLLDNEVSALPALINKPIILALAYPSATGAASGCLTDGSGGCLDWDALSQPNPDTGTVALDLQGQADLYEAVLTAVNSRSWISGIVSRGYYLPAALQDKSASVHGKPAADILWYWFPRMLGVVQ
jgi:Tat protein translocase TatC